MDGRPVGGGGGGDECEAAVGGVEENELTLGLAKKKLMKEDPLDSKPLPTFGQYIVEDIEGSGGYGTVYRARRKSDGSKFAIKYPHPNAIKHYVDNEREMLERFGGMNFVIKYEGSCRSENTDCIVLQHVEHDRPGLLKKIDVFEIQWYAYCMLTALARLHKLGVVHRDVKPGNFLFSRKTCIGYLADFNFAKVLHQKQPNTGKSMNEQKPLCPSKKRKIMDAKAPGPGGLARLAESKMLYKKSLSAKDLGSGRERLKEPLPCQGRKELVNLAREAMRTPEQVHSRVQKDVPCAGTKGFCAPEVLFRSIHQSLKLDVWSAGATLLFLLMGSLPFIGNTQHNIIQIAKLRGSEQVLELAEMHGCQSSVPADLRDCPPMELREWCKANTRRPDLMEAIPESLLDLVDRCLAVDPRCRISAKEALKHEFLAPCVSALRKARMLRKQCH